MVTFPNSPIAHRDCLHGARCDEPPCRWLPRGTSAALASHTRGCDAAAPLLVMWCGFFGAEVQYTGLEAWRTAFLSSHPPFSSFFPFLSFLFLWASFFYRRESGSSIAGHSLLGKGPTPNLASGPTTCAHYFHVFARGRFFSSFLFFAWLVALSFVSLLFWGSLSMGMTLTVMPSGSRKC